MTKKVYNIVALYNYTTEKANGTLMRGVTSAIKAAIVPHEDTILTGDFNFVENDIDRTNGMYQHDKTIANVWKKEMKGVDLVDVFRHKNPSRQSWTHKTSRNTGSRIGRLFVSEQILPNVIEYKHINTPFGGAHRMLSFTIKHQIEKGPNYWKMNTSILKDREYRREIEQLFQEMDEMNIEDSIEWWQIFVSCVQAIAMKDFQMTEILV